jgi:hypothetical protein
MTEMDEMVSQVSDWPGPQKVKGSTSQKARYGQGKVKEGLLKESEESHIEMHAST